MTKKAQPQTLTPEQLRNELITQAFEQITNDGLHILTPFEATKYRTVVTVDHSNNERYPNLIRESISYFWNLTMSMGKTGNLVVFYTYDQEALTKFGTVIFNRMLRSIFKHTMAKSNGINIEDCVRISSGVKDIHNFFYKRLIDGETENVKLRALDHVPT